MKIHLFRDRKIKVIPYGDLERSPGTQEEIISIMRDIEQEVPQLKVCIGQWVARDILKKAHKNHSGFWNKKDLEGNGATQGSNGSQNSASYEHGIDEGPRETT